MNKKKEGRMNQAKNNKLQTDRTKTNYDEERKEWRIKMKFEILDASASRIYERHQIDRSERMKIKGMNEYIAENTFR
jgi:hypothetical protein